MSSIFYLEAKRRWVVSWTNSSGRRVQRRFPDEQSARSFTPSDERPSRRDTRAAEVKFAERYRVDASGCWTWTHHKTSDGYAQMTICGTPTLMHRWSFERYVSSIPSGRQIDHLCRNRACVNPAHLDAVTPRENVRRSPFTQASLNAAKTHCPQGHEYTPENTYAYGPHRRWRQCRTCMRDASARTYARRKAEAVPA